MFILWKIAYLTIVVKPFLVAAEALKIMEIKDSAETQRYENMFELVFLCLRGQSFT